MWRWAAQNIHFAEEGAYTGETSIGQLKAVGGTHTLIGHSERRQYFAETDEIVNKKLHRGAEARRCAVVCVGEVLEEREAGKTANVLKTQMTGAFAGITAEVAQPIVIAYEPVWAIGTGKTATPEMAVEAHASSAPKWPSCWAPRCGCGDPHSLRRQREAGQCDRADWSGRDRRRTGGRSKPEAGFVRRDRQVLMLSN